MERITNLSIEAATGKDDKECGVFSIKVWQGAGLLTSREYGDGQDWDKGHVLRDTIAMNVPVTNEPLRCVVALEERPGQVNITWDADIRSIRLSTNQGRQATFSGPFRFDTDHNKPDHKYDMGTQNFA